MKATIERDKFLKALAHVSGVAEKQNVPHILGNVLVRFDSGGKLHLRTTDSEMEMQESVAVTIDKEGNTTVPAQVLHQIVDRLPDGAELEITNDGKELQLQSGKAKFLLQCLPSDEFPVLSKPDEITHKVKIAGKDLYRLLTKTRAAISDAGPRYYLQGVYLHKPEDAEVLRAVATDGHRLAHVDASLKDLPKDLPAVIVPRKAVGEILRLLTDDSEEMVEISFSPNKIGFALQDQQITSKLIDGNFPDYKRVIPEDNDKEAKIDIKSFGKKVQSVSAIAQGGTGAVRLKLEKDNMVLEVAQNETGSASDELPIGYGGEALEIGFNAAYLSDVAEQVEGDTITMVFKDSNSPALVRDDADKDALYIVMPMRV